MNNRLWLYGVGFIGAVGGFLQQVDAISGVHSADPVLGGVFLAMVIFPFIATYFRWV